MSSEETSELLLNVDEFGPERVPVTVRFLKLPSLSSSRGYDRLRPIIDMDLWISVIAMDTIVNQAAKTRYMFGGKGQVPTTVRCAAGNGVGSAAHSQSLESWFTHIPGLKGCSTRYTCYMKGTASSIRDNNPVIILEYKSEFNQKGKCQLIQTTNPT